MGFGSYDESEQRDQNSDLDEEDAVDAHEHDHDGSVSFETEESSEDLVARLQQMRDDDEQTDE